MSQRYSRLRTALVVSILSAGIVLGAPLSGASRAATLEAVRYWTADTASDWRLRRAQTAAYLVLASPDYQVQP